MTRGGESIRGTLLAVLAFTACTEPEPPQGSVAPPAAVPPARLPETRDEVLERVLPVPGGRVVVVYELVGEQGLSGSLEVLVASGGWRRENWVLRLPPATDGATPRETRGTTIQTPDGLWTGVGTSRVRGRAVALGRLAEELLARPPAQQREIFASIAAWREALERGSGRSGEPSREVAGRRCAEIRVAAQRLCLWEATGLPLAYEGPALRATALRIDEGAALAGDAFAVGSTPATLDPGEPFDTGVLLDELAVGRWERLATLVQPGFRPPDP
jgi:hypothetical protein